MFKRYEWTIMLKVALMFITISLAAFLLTTNQVVYEILVVPVIIYQVIDFSNCTRKRRMKSTSL